MLIFTVAGMYLLEFCRKLITFTGGIENLQVIDNRDGTRSLLNRISKKLLVTFRAENQVRSISVHLDERMLIPTLFAGLRQATL